MRRAGRALSRRTASRRTSATSRRATRPRVRAHGPSDVHRRSFQALCYADRRARSTEADAGPSGGRWCTTGCAATGSSGTNVWAGGNEIDLIARRGRQARLLRGQVEGRRAGSATRSRWSATEKQRRLRARGRGLARVAARPRRARASLRGRRRPRRQARARPSRALPTGPVRYPSRAEGHYPRTGVARQNGSSGPGASAFQRREKPSAVRMRLRSVERSPRP